MCIEEETQRVWSIPILMKDYPKGIQAATWPVTHGSPRTRLDYTRETSDGKDVYNDHLYNFAVTLQEGQVFRNKILEWLKDAKDGTKDVLVVWDGLQVLIVALREEKEKKHFE